MIDFDLFAKDVLSVEAFAQAATYTPAGGQGKSVFVVMETEYSAPDGSGLTGVSTSAPIATCRASDMENAARGDTLRVGTVTYNVTEVLPDGGGFIMLRLSRD